MDDDMNDPDNINEHWDRLLRESDDEAWGMTPKLRVVDEDFPKPPEDDPLPGVADPSEWDGRNAPDRRFIIPGWIVRGSAGLLSGMEGVGKSLIAQQLATCAAVGKQFLGLDVEHVNAIYITCEDSIDELWRRQETINKALGITMDDIAGRLKLVSLVGELGNELGAFDSGGALTPSKRYRQILKLCIDFGAGFVVLDNAAHLFAGNENARHDVAAFLGLLERLSQVIDGAALLLAHPNKQHSQGNKQGNEYSGSTGWSAHVRNRLFLDYRTDTDDGVPIDDDERVLRKSKANYGKRGEEIAFRWHDWAFVRLEDLQEGPAREIAAVAVANGENARFLECLEARTKEKRAVSEQEASPTYAPRIFAKMEIAKGMKVEAFKRAMDRLFSIEQVERGALPWDKSRGHPAEGLRLTGKNRASDPRVSHASDTASDMRLTKNATKTNGRASLRPTDTPSTTYIGEPLEGSLSMYDSDHCPTGWETNPLLNPDIEAWPPAWMDEAPPWDDEGNDQ